MEARTEIAAAEPGVAHALQMPQPLLRLHGGGVEDRMIIIIDAVRHLLARHLPWIERDEEWSAMVDVLQLIHPVSDAKIVVQLVVGVAQVIPASPGHPALGHQQRIAMQHRLVWPITDTSEKIALFRA